MRTCRYDWGLLLAVIVLAAVMGAAGAARAQSDAEEEEFYSRIMALQFAGNHAEAIPLAEHYIEATKARHGPDSPKYANGLYQLGVLLWETKRLGEAEPLMRRALAIYEKSYGPEHYEVATYLNNLGLLLWTAKRPTEAEPFYRRAIAIREKNYGPEHPTIAFNLNNLALLLQDTNRPAEAEPLYYRAIALFEKSYGPESPEIGGYLTSLALLRAEQGDWAGAVGLHRRAKPIMTRAQGNGGGDFLRVALSRKSWAFRSSARAEQRGGGRGAEALEEGFELAQWALQTGAADAPNQVAVHFAKGGGSLAQLVRERQDLITRRQNEYKRIDLAVGAADAKAAEVIRMVVANLDAKLDVIDRRLAADFPDYASLANPKPLSIGTVQHLLRADEVLLLILDVPLIAGSRLPEETLVWAVTKNEARWISVPLGTAALAERVAKLRCGLDRDALWSWSGVNERWEANGAACRALASHGLAADAPLPFDLDTAHELYDKLLAPFAELTEGKHLIIVPSGPLTSLPFHVLVTELPGATVSDPKVLTTSYRAAAWFALRQPITMLPSVGGLQALRKLAPSKATEPYIAFGNPLLDGSTRDKARGDLARTKQRCPRDIESLQHGLVVNSTRHVPSLGKLFRSSSVDLPVLRAQTPLPETADELCAVAKAVGALGREVETVWLGARATEANLKMLSREGKLARHRVLHFATHGLLASESEVILNAKAEPALLLTPPKDGTTLAELEEDDGLLTASEVAQLTLDADWVLLSACNTAAGDKGDAEALSGLARAFFYAKARAILVSHWYVNSEAAVRITTRAFDLLGANPKLGRAEALRGSMIELITRGLPEAHPEYWAPFVLVGEGRS